MNNEKKSLGRGLDSLLGEAVVKKQSTVTEIPIEELAPGQYQPRKRMHKDTLEELSDSIKQQGVLQPIVVRKQASGLYEIVVGERRWRAAQLAGLETVPSIIKDINNSQAARISLIENLQREDLNAMDQARGLQRLQMEFNLSQEDLGIAVGKSRSSITNLLRLTKLSQDVQKMLEQGMIEMGHARALLSLKEERQAALARDIVKRKLSVREVEELVSKENTTTKPKEREGKKDPNTEQIEREISEVIGATTEITIKKKGGGKLTINFNSPDHLQGILEKIKN